MTFFVRPRVAQAKSRDLDTFADFGQETSHGLGGSGGVIRVVVVVAVGEWTATRRRLGGQGACLFGLLKHGQKNQEIGGNCEIVVQMSGFWMPPLSWRRRVRRPRSALAESSHNCTCRIGPPSIRKTVKKKKKKSQLGNLPPDSRDRECVPRPAMCLDDHSASNRPPPGLCGGPHCNFSVRIRQSERRYFKIGLALLPISRVH